MQEDKSPKKTLTKQQALSKAQHYCAYQERSHQEARDKLYSWGLHRNEVEEIISELIEENFLNEERFAIAYALGKFRIKHWGKIKIKHHLKGKRVPEKLIQHAINQINTDEYGKKIIELAEKYKKTTKTKELTSLKIKIHRFLLSKGYENTIIIDTINDII